MRKDHPTKMVLCWYTGQLQDDTRHASANEADFMELWYGEPLGANEWSRGDDSLATAMGIAAVHHNKFIDDASGGIGYGRFVQLLDRKTMVQLRQHAWPQ